jgi:transcriptional regulator with XRE-family HTH domain
VQSDELGHCIRAWRDRLDPAAAGLPAGPRRRAPGLRREELAGLAGVSVDYLSRLEQGRATNPSPPVLASLARALRLSEEERCHLSLVAGAAPPGGCVIDRHITPGVQRMLDRLEEMAVVVYDATWDLVAWNRLGAALVGDLRATSEDFERHWARGEIAVRTASRKVIEHPEVGPILVDCDVLTVRSSNLRLIVYSTSPGTEDAEKFALVSVVGLQRMAG